MRKRWPERYRLGRARRLKPTEEEANWFEQVVSGSTRRRRCGGALFIISFLPWFGVGGVTVSGTTIRDPRTSASGRLRTADICLLIVILVALVPGDGAAGRRDRRWRHCPTLWRA
jgi:hypothetical protein